METQHIQKLTATFEGHAQRKRSRGLAGPRPPASAGVRQVGQLSGRDFQGQAACEMSGHAIADHFADVGKMVDLGSGSQREVDATGSAASPQQKTLQNPQRLPDDE